MAFALRGMLWLVAAAVLAGCYKTELPRYSGSRGGYTASAKSVHTSYYTVRRGDTLYSIGRRFGVDYKLLARRNHIRYPYTIFVGQHLYLTRIAPRSQSLPISRATARHTSPPRKAVHVRKSSKSSTSHSSRHASGASSGSVRLRWPINGTVTSPFGRRGSRMHDGIDIAAKRGTPIHAAASGVVVYSDRRLSGYGRMIIIRHSGDMFTAYAHNERNLVRKGDRVKQGDVIARVGSTGRATGPHLHFEVRRGTTPVDPKAYLP
jgi:lipoprotein NlpD